MTPEAFKRWLATMKAAGLAKSDADCARLLGISANAVVYRKKHGATYEVALACQALGLGLVPFE